MLKIFTPTSVVIAIIVGVGVAIYFNPSIVNGTRNIIDQTLIQTGVIVITKENSADDVTKKKICKKLGANIRQNYRRLGVANPANGSLPLNASIENYESLAIFFKCKRTVRKILMDAEQELATREFR